MTREEASFILANIDRRVCDDELNDALDMAIKALEQEPKTGHWIPIDEEPHEDYECDNCGYMVSTFTANILPHTEYKYCPNCGCRMKSEE